MAKALTIGEMAKVEELSGLSVAHFDDNDKPRGLFMAAMAFVIKKREDPKLTFAAVLDMEMEEVATIVTDFKAAAEAADKSAPEKGR